MRQNNYDSLSAYLKKINSSSNIILIDEKRNDIDDCIEKLKKVINKYEKNKNNKIPKKRLLSYKKEIQDTCEIVCSCLEKNLDDIEPLKQNKIYNYLFKAGNCSNIYTQRINSLEINSLENKVKETTKKLDSTIREIDNIWGNVISVILSFSMVAALISGIEKVPKEYFLLFSFLVIWIGMTLLLFFSNLFDNKQLGTKTSKMLYIVFSITTIIVAFVTSFNTLSPYFNKNSNSINNSNSIPVMKNN